MYVGHGCFELLIRLELPIVDSAVFDGSCDHGSVGSGGAAGSGAAGGGGSDFAGAGKRRGSYVPKADLGRHALGSPAPHTAPSPMAGAGGAGDGSAASDDGGAGSDDGAAGSDDGSVGSGDDGGETGAGGLLAGSQDEDDDAVLAAYPVEISVHAVLGRRGLAGGRRRGSRRNRSGAGGSGVSAGRAAAAATATATATTDGASTAGDAKAGPSGFVRGPRLLDRVLHVHLFGAPDVLAAENTPTLALLPTLPPSLFSPVKSKERRGSEGPEATAPLRAGVSVDGAPSTGVAGCRCAWRRAGEGCVEACSGRRRGGGGEGAGSNRRPESSARCGLGPFSPMFTSPPPPASTWLLCRTCLVAMAWLGRSLPVLCAQPVAPICPLPPDLCPRSLREAGVCTDIGMAECTVDDLFSSEEGCVCLDVTGPRGGVAASVSLSVVALKQGNAERPGSHAGLLGGGTTGGPGNRSGAEFARRVSRWYLMETADRDRIVIEEDLRESRYAFEVPSQVRDCPGCLCGCVECMCPRARWGREGR